MMDLLPLILVALSLISDVVNGIISYYNKHGKFYLFCGEISENSGKFAYLYITIFLKFR